MELQVHKAGGREGLEVSDQAFGREFNEGLVHQVVTAYLAGGRAGTKAQKTRAEVRGGGRKPWRQKGTGRARAGTIRSPLWTGGGRIFAARPRDYSQKVNRKMYRGAISAMLSELARQERLLVTESFAVEQPRTREIVQKLSELGLEEALIVTTDPDENLYLAARNLPKVDVREVSEIDPVSLAGFENIVMTVPAVRKIEEWLS